MPEPWSTFVALALGCLLGAIPFALVLGRVAGVGLRRVGSRNVGAGNLTRHSGQASLTVGGRFALSVIVLFRRMQGNVGVPPDLPSRLYRMVWDTDRATADDTFPERAVP